MSSKENPIFHLSGHTSEVTSVCFSGTEKEIFSGGSSGTIIMYDLDSQKIQGTLKGHLSKINCMSPQFPENNYLVSGSIDCSIKIWDIRKKSCVQSFKEHTKPVTCAQFSPDSKLVASGSEDGYIKIYDLTAGKKLTDFTLGTEIQLTCLEFNPCQLTLAAGYRDRKTRNWDLETLTFISSTTDESTAIQKIAWEPEEGLAFFSASTESLKVYEFEKSVILDSQQAS